MNSYDGNWGIDSKHGRVPRAPKPTGVSTTGVINSYLSETTRKCACDDWLSKLSSNYQHGHHEDSEYVSHIKTQDALVFWINKLFAKLEGFADRFNCNLEASYTFIDSAPPDFHTVRCRANEEISFHEIEKIVFEGHLSTRNATLLLRGNVDTIEAFVVPASVWLGLSINELDETDYPPFVILKIENDKLKATIADPQATGDLPIDASSLPLLARLLFSKLIEFDQQLQV